MPIDAPDVPTPIVCVIGAATAGAEVAARLADRGAVVVVLDMNRRPYGKIEDGLPRWHEALRDKEYGIIREKLTQPGVHLLPATKVGRDVEFSELCNDWGFNAVVLACGAWSDRPLPIEGADAWVGKGLYYQNPFVIDYNHRDEPGYEGPRYPILDGALVVGGGLASVDVAKIHTLECTRAELAKRGIELPLVELEVKGIPRSLAAHDLTWEDLGLEGCTIYYRRRRLDMPLMEIPEGADDARREKVYKGRERMIAKATEKYCFDVVECAAPEGLIVEDDRLVGLVFRRTRIEDGRVVPTDETFEARGSQIVSSIGSIPDPIPGIQMKGELFDFSDWDTGRLAAYPSVFSAGNVVTGKGNIVASRKHATHVTEDAIEQFLGLAQGEPEGIGGPVADQAAETSHAVAAFLATQAPAPVETLRAILERVAERQAEIGYTDLASWLEK